MKTEISRLPLNEWKHSLGVFLQMGRVQLDSDWNDQTEIAVRSEQRLANDVVRDGSPNHGFRVDDRVLLDSMDLRTAWQAEKSGGDPDPRVYVDYFDFRTGEGSLSIEGATAAARKFDRAEDCTQWNDIVVWAKGSFLTAKLVIFLGEGGTRGHLTTSEDAATIEGWRIFRAQPSTAPSTIDLSQIDEIGFVSLDKAQRYQIDAIFIDRPVKKVLVPIGGVSAFSATVNAGDTAKLSINEDDRRSDSFVLEAEKVTSINYAFPAEQNLSAARGLIISARTVGGGSPAVTVTLTDALAAQITLAAPVVATAGSWETSTFALPQAGAFAWNRVAKITFGGLSSGTTYRLAPVQIVMSIAGNLVIMGGDGTSEGAGRFYGDGLPAVKEADETYFSQRDLPLADPAAVAPPAAGSTRIDLAYLDLWERPITYIEDPDLREIALEGPDTCTRTQLIAQVRILKGAEVAVGGTPEPPTADLHALLPFGQGVLTTRSDTAAVADPCADPCEPEIAGTFLGEENRLFRVEIHKFGQIGLANAATTALFKWSRENGAVASALLENAAAGAFSVKVEKPELFREGDLIEISNDLADLATGPYEDVATHRAHERGELRKITSIHLADRLIAWDDAASSEPQFHAALVRPQHVVWHANIRRWDAVLPVTAGPIALADGVVIEFGGTDLLPADYWVFTTRVADRSVEKLIEEPPRGVLHRYFPLARVHRKMDGGAETVVCKDLRLRFEPLTALRATDIAYDPGLCANDDPAWAAIDTVQQAIDALCRQDIGFDLRDHNKHLHGYGVVCGLQVNCNADRKQVTIQKGYALDCEGHVLRVRSPITFPLVAEGTAAGMLPGGSGGVCLSISRGVTTDVEIHVEPAPTKTFWQTVLEGTLLLDFYNKAIKPVIDFFRASFLPIPATTIPVPVTHKNVVCFLNLLAQLPFLWPATAKYVFLSAAEDDLLRKFYNALKELIRSKTFCAIFDGIAPFPAYPYAVPPGIDTAFGLFRFHKRMRKHPKGTVAYTCGTGSQIHVYDLKTNELVASLDFPGGSNVEVKDVAVSPDQTKLYAVGILKNQDSVFATATISPGHVYKWGPTSVVCDILFVTLGTASRFPNNLYAIGLSQGIYVLDPTNIPLAPVADVKFNATGIMEISDELSIAFAAETTAQPIGTVSTSFTRFRSANLTALAGAPVLYAVQGQDAANDVAILPNPPGGSIFITGISGPGIAVFRFNIANGLSLGAPTPLPVNTVVRLTIAGGNKWLLVTIATEHRALRIDLATFAIDVKFRIPVQLFPFDIASDEALDGIYVLNMLSCTLSVITASTVLNAVQPPFTLEPPISLSTYRSDIIKAFAELLGKFVQYLKDAFCDQFLVNCPDCSRKDVVYLGCVEVKGGQVYKICNFTLRRYVKSVQMVEYWLSTIPILPVLKQAFARFCCRVL